MTDYSSVHVAPGAALPSAVERTGQEIPLPHPARSAVSDVNLLREALARINDLISQVGSVDTTAIDVEIDTLTQNLAALQAQVALDLAAGLAQLRSDILGGVDGAWDTLQEIQALVQDGDVTLQNAIDALNNQATANAGSIVALGSRTTDVETTVAALGNKPSGGPGLGTNSIIRTNATNIIEDITLSDHDATFTADAGADTLSVGTDDGYDDGDVVYLSTTGTLPAGLAAATKYYVRDVAASSLKLAATFGGTAIDITDTGTGTHTVYQAINGMTVGPISIEGSHSVTVPHGSTWTVI